MVDNNYLNTSLLVCSVRFSLATRKSNFTGENGLLRDVGRVSIIGRFDVNIRLIRKKDKKNVFFVNIYGYSIDIPTI